MIVTTAPDLRITKFPKLFLAGGITNCPDWQLDVIQHLRLREAEDKYTWNIQVFNPRRENFPIHDPNAAMEQIKWEFNRLKESEFILFWFSRGSLNPIVLYELGMWGNSRTTPIVVGMDPEYERKQDVRIQTALARPGIQIADSMDRVITELTRVMHPKRYQEMLP
jgi:hypothetical protein